MGHHHAFLELTVQDVVGARRYRGVERVPQVVRFADYQLEVDGLVRRPLCLSPAQLRELGWQTQITKHNCIQGWSAITKWGGVPWLTC
jgi:DMSO/TMAO reductase YedYZ molybdopterin-dependent catalytic subunit